MSVLLDGEGIPTFVGKEEERTSARTVRRVLSWFLAFRGEMPEAPCVDDASLGYFRGEFSGRCAGALRGSQSLDGAF